MLCAMTFTCKCFNIHQWNFCFFLSLYNALCWHSWVIGTPFSTVFLQTCFAEQERRSVCKIIFRHPKQLLYRHVQFVSLQIEIWMTFSLFEDLDVVNFQITIEIKFNESKKKYNEKKYLNLKMNLNLKINLNTKINLIQNGNIL